jgi:hypothetical protein
MEMLVLVYFVVLGIPLVTALALPEEGRLQEVASGLALTVAVSGMIATFFI